MNKALKAILLSMLNQRCFNNKHAPEKRLIVSRTKWLNRDEKKDFEKQYHEMLNQGIILRMKKRTGKGSDWHISLNSREMTTLNRFLNEEERKD